MARFTLARPARLRGEVAVVGFGPHGAAACAALGAAGAPVTVIDPEAGALGAWSRRAAGIGMSSMRSPWVHHISPDVGSLHRYVAGRGPLDCQRPSVAQFVGHARCLLTTNPPLHIRDEVVALTRAGHRWRLELAAGPPVLAERVVVATGLDPHRRTGLAGGRALPDRAVGAHSGPVAVVGGGHTATTAAATLLRSGHRVDLFAPAGLAVRSTDVDPGWFGPKHLTGYARLGCAERVAVLRAERVGSTPAELVSTLTEQIACGRLRVITARAQTVTRAPADPGGAGYGLPGGDRLLAVRAGRDWRGYSAVYCATGYRIDIANVGWLAPWTRQTHGGWPVLDHALQLAPGLHLLGALSELELGPAGRNLWGAQRGVERLLEAVGALDPDPDRSVPATPPTTVHWVGTNAS